MKNPQKKVEKVMHEFKEHELTSHGKTVTNPKQAVAIALSEAGLSNKKEHGGNIKAYDSIKKELEGKDQQHRINELIKAVEKHKWSASKLTVDSGIVKTYSKMYDLEPIRVAAIFNKYQKKAYAKGGNIDSKSSYDAMLRKYDQLGAYLEDAIEEKNETEVTRLKSEMSALETKINNYERGSNTFNYSIGGL